MRYEKTAVTYLFYISLAVITALISSCAPGMPNTTYPPSISGADITASNATQSVICTRIEYPVSISTGDAKEYSVACWLTASGNAHDTAIITIPGASYSHVYWDFPYKPEIYSFTQYLAGAGYSTVNIDRMGSGDSSKPQAHTTTIDAQAYVVHQLVQALRLGKIGGIPYKKVVLAGHSLGSYIAAIEAARYHDVDGVMLTGFSHDISVFRRGAMDTLKSFYPAGMDPILRGKDLQPFALTTYPGTRVVFYNPKQVETEIIQVDEMTKTTFSIAEVNDSAFRETTNIVVPVLLALGESDSAFCTPPEKLASDVVLAAESKYYTPKVQLEVLVVPGAGHNINLHYSAQQWFESAIKWIQRKIY